VAEGGGLIAAGDVAPTGSVEVTGGGTLTVADTLTISGTNTFTVGGTDNYVKFTKATITGTEGTVLTGSGTVTLAPTDTIVLADTGSIVVAGTGTKVSLPNTEFGTGTYKAAGAVTITAVALGDTIATQNVADNGLILGAENTALSLLTQDTTVATYTFVKGTDKKVVLGNGPTAITVGNGATAETAAGSVTATAKASIKLGTSNNATDAINLGNGSELVLTAGAKIGVFTDSSVADVADGSGSDAIAGSIGGATVTGTTTAHKLTNSSGTLSPAAGGNATLTGATAGTSVIKAAAVFVAGTVGT
jgi:hypothetical protein